MIFRHRTVYLDNNATTPVDPAVARRMSSILRALHGNPSALYREGLEARTVVEESRRTVAQAIGARPEEVVFTGSASEANATAIASLAERKTRGRRTILSSPLEHPSVMAALTASMKDGIKVVSLPIDGTGSVDVEASEHLMRPDVFGVVCMLANNEIGTIQNVQELARRAKKRGIPVFSDCVQALGKIPVDVGALGLDYASFSAHKIYGPKGIGALFCRRNAAFAVVIPGGHQEFGRRAGTESVHNIAGFAEACDAIPRLLDRAGDLERLRESLFSSLAESVPQVVRRSSRYGCLPNTLSVSLPGFQNSVLLESLDRAGISVSAGSACSSRDNDPSHVLTAIGLTLNEARETIRISLSIHTNSTDIAYTARQLKRIAENRSTRYGTYDPRTLTAERLKDPDLYLLDVRFPHDRMFLRSIPGSHETSSVFVRSALDRIPKDKHVVVVCQSGFIAPFVAGYLVRNGFDHVSFLRGGAKAWRSLHPSSSKLPEERRVSRL